MALSRTAAGGTLRAFVLHQWDWSESSLIVELWTRERGRLAVVAKGAKRPTSQFRALLLPFQLVGVGLGRAPVESTSEAPVELFNLRAAEWIGGVPVLGAHALMSGFYANELLMRLLPRLDPHPVLWEAYADTVAALAAPVQGEGVERAQQSALRAFELVLLRELGWLPDLASVSQTQRPLDPAAPYGLHPEFGLVEEPDANLALPGAWMATAAQALLAADLRALRACCGARPGPLRHQLRRLVHYHLGAPLLRTREVWRGVQRLKEPVKEPVKESEKR